MIRAVLMAPVGLLFALVLFYALAILSGSGKSLPVHEEVTPEFNFLMVDKDPRLELRKRERPPEPEMIDTQQQPEMPQIQQDVISVNTPKISIDIPNIDVGINVALSPSLNNLAMPTPEIVVDTNPTIISQVPPSYPRRALRKKIEGRVTVEFMVTTSGSVDPNTVVIVESNPPGVFDSVVQRAIQRWRFKTRIEKGAAVPFKTRQTLEFKLET
jgi:protein TonB